MVWEDGEVLTLTSYPIRRLSGTCERCWVRGADVPLAREPWDSLAYVSPVTQALGLRKGAIELPIAKPGGG